MSSPSDRTMGEVLDFMRLLWGLDHALQAKSKRMNSSLGVTGPQRLVVRLVGRYPGITAGELARLQKIHPSTLTGVLERLETRGLLKREADPTDQRRAHLHLTAKGERLNQTRAGTVEADVRKALERLTPEQIEATRQTLLAIEEELIKAPAEKKKRSPKVTRA